MYSILNFFSRFLFPEKFEQFESLPDEVRVHILSFLSVKDLLSTAQGSKGLLNLTKTKYLWVEIGRELELSDIDKEEPQKFVLSALKLAIDIEKLNFFPRRKFDNLYDHYWNIKNQITTPEFHEKLNAEAASAKMKIISSGIISDSALSKISFLKQIGAEIPKEDFVSKEWCLEIIASPLFSRIAEAMGPFNIWNAIKLFLHAFEIFDLKTCCILAQSFPKEGVIKLRSLESLSTKHLKIAKKLRLKGIQFDTELNLDMYHKVFESAKFAAKWLSLKDNEVPKDLKFPNNYFNKSEDFKVAKVFFKAGYKIPKKYLKAQLRNRSYENLSEMIQFYYDRPVINIPVPMFDSSVKEDKLGLKFIEAITPIISDSKKRFCANFPMYKTNVLTPIRKKIGEVFLSFGKEISLKTFQRAIDAENFELIKDLIALYKNGLYIDYQFPLKYFFEPVHFEIAALFVEAGFKLPFAHLGIAIRNQELENVKQFIPLYQNQAPMDIPIPADFPEEKLSELISLLKQLT